MDIFERLVERLKEKHLKVASAESCTAGLFAADLAAVPGASSVLEYGFVVYSAAAKQRILGVPQKVIGRYGVVSEQTARAMAQGAKRVSGADLSVGITGFAGPDADEGYTAGTVCFGFCCRERSVSETVDFGDIGRNRVRQKCAEYAAERFLELLEEKDAF